jgi:hypothetical protein
MSETAQVEYEFQVKDIDVEIQNLEAQIARLNLEKEKYIYQKILLANNYSEYLENMKRYDQGIELSKEINLMDNTLDNFEVTGIVDGVTQIKPRRLKTS